MGNQLGYRMGPAVVTFDGVLQSWLTRGMEAVATPEFQAIDFDGLAQYDDMLSGLAAEVSMAVAIRDPNMMDVFLPYINKIVDGTKVLYDGVIDIGRSMRERGKPLLLHPLDMGNDPSNDFYMPLAVCTSPFKLTYKDKEIQILEAKFKGYVLDRTSKRLFQIGDRTANADTTAPTVTSSTPANNATAIDKAVGLTIDFVMSKAIDPATVTKANTLMFKASDEAMFTGYSVSYDSGTRTIRLTTDAALTGSTQYAVVLGGGIRDLAGNTLATPHVMKFTTGA